MTLTNSTPPQDAAAKLHATAEQVQYTAERIAQKVMQYKTLVSAPKYCQVATYVRHQQELQHTRAAMLVSLRKLDRLKRQFAKAAEEVQCTETN